MRELNTPWSRPALSTGHTRRRTLTRTLTASAALAGAAALAACGQGQDGNAPSSGPAATGQITFLSRDSGSDLEPYKQGIEQFNAAQPRVKVTHELTTGNFEQKFQTLMAAGTVPEVSYMHSQNVPTFATQGFLAPLDTYTRRDRAALDGLLPAAVDSYRFKNAAYGVPDVATSLVMFVNRALFTKAGVPIPAEKWAWADFLGAAQKLQNANRAEGAFGAVDYNGGFPRFTVLWQNDADLLSKDRTAVTVDQPAAIEALQWIADLMHRHQVHPKPADLQGKSGEAFFLEGKAAMFPVISSRMGTVARGAQFDVEVVHLPQGKRRVTRTACGGTAMPKGSARPDAGWELEKFFATEAFQWLIARAGGIIFPAHKKVTESPELFAGGPFPRSPKITVDAMAYARTEAYTVGYQDLVAAFNKEVDTVWKGESGVRDAMTRARAAMDPILKDALAR
jgi:multiple sugar transport system substrate-binding protein